MEPTRTSAERTSADRVSEETDNSANSYIIELMERSSQGSRNSRPSHERGEARNSAERTSDERSRSPFASDVAQATPMPRDSLEANVPRPSIDRSRDPTLARVDENAASAPSPPIATPRNTSLQSQPSPGTRMAMFHDYRQQIGTRGAFSLEQPRPPRPRPRPSTSNELRISMDLPAHIGAQVGHPPDEVVRARLTRKRRRLPLQWVIGFGVVSSCCLVVALTTLSIGLYNFTKLRQNRAAKSVQGLEDDLKPVFENMTASIAAVQVGVNVLLNLAGQNERGVPP